MGKFRKRVGGSKGKRWPKGESALSNPESHKYRDLAMSRFQYNSGPSTLTVKALKKHDNKLLSFSEPRLGNDESNEMEEDHETATQSSSRSLHSYASSRSLDSYASSVQSGCTNMSFNRFFDNLQPKTILHKRMLCVLNAVRRVIEEKNGTQSSSEYFLVLMACLTDIYETKEEIKIAAILSLSNMCVRTTNECILRVKFAEITQKLVLVLKDYMVSENNLIIKSVLSILGHMLRIIEPAFWNHYVIKIYNKLLNPFCVHSKPKLRKCAQKAVVDVVKYGIVADVSPNLAAIEVAKFCEEKLNIALGQTDDNTVLVSSLKNSQKTILHILNIMADVICYLPKKHIKSCCEIILKLITLNNDIVTHSGFNVLHSLFSSPQADVPTVLNGQLITALYDYQPASSEAKPTHAWLIVMQKAHIHLAGNDLSMASEAFPKLFSTLTQLWFSEKPTVQTNLTYSLEILLKDAVAPACATKQLVDQYNSKIAKVFKIIENCLSYQYNTVWHHVLHVISVMFEVGGSNCKEMFISTLTALTELRDSYKFTYNNELENAVGSAIRSLGPEKVLEVIPLKRENGDFNIDRSWMLPLLKENIKHSTLDYFTKNILSLAMFCHKKSLEMAEVSDGIRAHSAELLYFQLWNLLPSFCNNPSDIKENFKNIARILGTAISDHKDLRLPVMTSLRKLINFAKNKEDKDDLNELARFDKNYLPILFNLYTTKPIGTDEEGHRLAALETIKLYFTISKPELTGQLFQNCFDRLTESSEDPEDGFIKENILDLICALVPFQSCDEIKIIYDNFIKTLPNITNKKEQKKAYRILEKIFSCETENCKQFITQNGKEVQKLLKASMQTAAVSSKGARLRCFHYLIKAQPQLNPDSKLVRDLIPEVVLACRDINENCRTTAYEVIKTIGEQLIHQEHVNEFVTLLVAGLGGTVQMISCTLLAFASVLHHFTGFIGQDNIQKLIENVSILMLSPSREIVGSCCSFINTYIKALPTPVVASALPLIMKSFCEMSEDCKRHYRLKTHNILAILSRKFGVDGIIPFVPPQDTVMHKRLKNLRKMEARKKRKEVVEKHESDADEEDEFIVNTKHKSVDEILADSDSDIEDMDTDEPKPRKTKIEKYIEEDANTIVDFADPTAISKVRATRPGCKGPIDDSKKKGKDRGFKTGTDGRLIIKDDSSDNETDEKKGKPSFDLPDSDDESIDTAPTITKKRKRSDTASVASGRSGTSAKSAASGRNSQYKPGGIGIHRPLDTVSVKSGTSVGSEYRSKKAKGDVKKTGKFEPYAYLPLKRSDLNKRNKNKTNQSKDYFLK